MDKMILTTDEALVTTATVQIRTLTVRGKQVTLAMFRQLDEVDPIDWSTWALRGSVWGRVNYHPERDRCPAGAHDHVVWQSERKLMRGTIRRSLSAFEVLKNYRSIKESADRFAKWVIDRDGEEEGSASSRDHLLSVRWKLRERNYPVMTAYVHIGSITLEANLPYGLPTDYEPLVDRENLVEAAHTTNHRARDWQEIREQIDGLEQLFIAI